MEKSKVLNLSYACVANTYSFQLTKRDSIVSHFELTELSLWDLDRKKYEEGFEKKFDAW